MEVHVTRDFVEPRKLQLAANDAVTVLQHRWVKDLEKAGNGVEFLYLLE